MKGKNRSKCQTYTKQYYRFTQCLNLPQQWWVKDKSPIGNDIQHDSNEIPTRHQPDLESL